MLAMRLLIAALVFTLAIAVTASVFAIWPAVADAPWEDSTAPDRTDEIRCQGGLDYRTAALANPPTRVLVGVAVTDQEALQRLLGQAESEIARYC